MSITLTKVKEGTLEGVQLKDCAVFRGVPYAAAPTGEKRFMPPQPHEGWSGVRRADTFSCACIQLRQPEGSFYDKEFHGCPERRAPLSEDCLYLNIWTPACDPDEKLPVAMWIHGGAFDHGYGFEVEFDGEAFARRGIVLVTINYRVNVFGFLHHPWLKERYGEKSANLGLQDQIAALRWIHENIAAFGGDPENVTVFGQSAGGMSTQSLLSSPLTEGLMHKAVIQSGGGYNNGEGLEVSTSYADAEAMGEKLISAMGIDSYEALMAMDAQTLIENAMAEARRIFPRYQLPFAPCVDGYVLRSSTNEALLNGQAHNIPVMLGATTNDIMAHGDANPLLDNCIRWGTMQEELGRIPAYVYHFTRALPGDDAGAFHSSELWYVFGTTARSWRPFTAADTALSEKMTDCWASFMRTGHPTTDGSWPVCTKACPHAEVLDIQA